MKEQEETTVYKHLDLSTLLNNRWIVGVIEGRINKSGVVAAADYDVRCRYWQWAESGKSM